MNQEQLPLSSNLRNILVSFKRDNLFKKYASQT